MTSTETQPLETLNGPLVATAMHIACIQSKVQRTQKSIAQTAGITETTLRNTLQMLFPLKKKAGKLSKANAGKRKK